MLRLVKVTHGVRPQARLFSSSRSLLAKSLVVAEHDNHKLGAATLNTISAAIKLGGPVDVLVAGHQCAAVAKTVSEVKGINSVIQVECPLLEHPTAERIVEVLQSEQTKNNYTHLLAPATPGGKNFMPRLGAQLDVQPISDIQDIKSEDTFVRPIYAGNALQTIKSKDKVKVITVRSTAFPPAEAGGSASVNQSNAPEAGVSKKGAFLKAEIVSSERPELTTAPRVVSGGRGLKAKENFNLVFELADCLNAAVGASRAVVDAGFVPNDFQVGQTGKIVAPQLYIAVGISGAIQHLAGMKSSKVIVAINNDEEAPIFQVADYGLVADLFTAVPELTAAVKKLKA